MSDAVRAAEPRRGLRIPALSPGVRLAAGVLIVTLGTASVVAHALEYRGVERFSKDFALDYASGKALLNGEDPYAPIEQLVRRYLDPPPVVLDRNILPGANWHTPFKLFVTLPLTTLPYRAAGVLWLLVCAGTIVAAGIVLGRRIGWTRAEAWALGFGLLAVPVVQIDLSAGNLNGPMLLLIVLAWSALLDRRDGAGGVLLGSVTALKFFPALLAGPLLAGKRFRAVTIAGMVTVIVTAGGLLALGGDHIRSFFEAGRGSEGFEHWDQAPANISWWGLATRWLIPNGWVEGVDASRLGLAVAFAGLAVLLAALLTPRSRLAGDSFLSALPLMLLAWPISWIHYLVLSLPWVLLAGREVARRGGPALVAGFGVVAVVMLMGFPPGAPEAETASAVQVATLYQLPTLALIAAALLDRYVSARAVDGSSAPAVGPPARDHR